MRGSVREPSGDGAGPFEYDARKSRQAITIGGEKTGAIPFTGGTRSDNRKTKVLLSGFGPGDCEAQGARGTFFIQNRFCSGSLQGTRRHAGHDRDHRDPAGEDQYDRGLGKGFGILPRALAVLRDNRRPEGGAGSDKNAEEGRRGARAFSAALRDIQTAWGGFEGDG